MYMINRRGPNTLPCGIPRSTSYQLEYIPSIITVNCLSWRKTSIQQT